jgi:hypothetical protein
LFTAIQADSYTSSELSVCQVFKGFFDIFKYKSKYTNPSIKVQLFLLNSKTN